MEEEEEELNALGVKKSVLELGHDDSASLSTLKSPCTLHM